MVKFQTFYTHSQADHFQWDFTLHSKMIRLPKKKTPLKPYFRLMHDTFSEQTLIYLAEFYLNEIKKMPGFFFAMLRNILMDVYHDH